MPWSAAALLKPLMKRHSSRVSGIVSLAPKTHDELDAGARAYAMQ